MILREFVEKFVCPNTLIRLWVPHYGGHMMLRNDLDEVGMEWWIRRNEGWQYLFADHEVIGVTDIRCDSYPEAVNIVIKLKGGDTDGDRREMQELRSCDILPDDGRVQVCPVSAPCVLSRAGEELLCESEDRCVE